MSNFYGAHCAAGSGGTVIFTVNGPVTYAGFRVGSLMPSNVSSNIVTWNIPDFGTVNFIRFPSSFSYRYIRTDRAAGLFRYFGYTNFRR